MFCIRMATLRVPLATLGPTISVSTGIETTEPPPATVLTKPASRPAAKTATISRGDTADGTGPYDAGMDDIPTEITCVECGGTANRMSYRPDEGFTPGDVVAFVCAECGQRHDVEIEADDSADGRLPSE